jgi:pre-mRNA-processing factor 40
LVIVQVKDHAAYQAVANNTSGSTPKELFEDFAEELDKQVYFALDYYQ